MSAFEKLKKEFENPDRRYAIYPIVHDRLGPNPDYDYYDRCGFAGVVSNVHYSRGSFPDNRADWDRVEADFRNFISRGMHTWIYDEEGYPSGTAGGYVTEEHPEYIAKGLYCYNYWKVIAGPCTYRADVPSDRLYKAVLLPIDGEGDAIDVSHCLNKNNVLYIDVPEGRYHLFMMSIRRLFDGTHATESYSEPRNYISLSDKEATRAFMSVTHERYKRILGDEFGRGVLAMFTDEPSLISWNIRYAVFPILPWHDKYPEEFKARYGYDFSLACIAVVLRRGPHQTKRRCDFWEYIADTVADGYFKTIKDWCHENGLKSSGHMLEEERLQAHIINYGSFYRSMKQMDWPGIDQLETVPAYLMDDSSIPIARFIASFADINGEREAFTEFSDHSVRMRGEFAPIDYYYHSVNWHHAMGINNFTSYYSWSNVTEDQKRELNKYTARLGYILRRGKRDSTVAMFYPEAAMWDAYQPNTEKRSLNLSDRMMSIQNAFTVCSWELLRRQIDFDYIDSDIILNGTVKDSRLIYRDREYSSIVMPCTRVLEDAVAQRLCEIARGGVSVCFVTESVATSRENGQKSPYADEINSLIDSGIIKLFSSYEGFGEAFVKSCPDRVRTVITKTYAPMVLSHSRITDSGERTVFICNMSPDRFFDEISIAGDFDEVVIGNCKTGEMIPAVVKKDDGRLTVSVDILSGEGLLILLK